MTGYNKIKRKSYKEGGFVEENAAALAGGANLIGDALMNFTDPKTANVGLTTASGAMKGAAAGMALGPLGALAGGAIGGISGLVGSLTQKKAIEQARLDAIDVAKQEQKEISNQTLADYDTNGVRGVQYYRKGGRLKAPRFAVGGILPDDPIKKAQMAKVKPRPYQPDITLPNWDGLVEKSDGTIGMWGNDITPGVQTVIPKVEVPMGTTDHNGRQSGHVYQGTPVVRDKIFEMEKRLKAASNMKGYAKGGQLPSYAKGGMVGDYEVEKDEVVQGQNTQLEEGTPLASDLQLVGGQTHENGGTEGIGGERVFSDDIKIGSDLAVVLKDLKLTSAGTKGTTYAKAAELLGKKKGKYEDKLNSGFTPAVNTGRKMLSRIDMGLDMLFENQEASKTPQAPLQTFADGGDLPYRKFANMDLGVNPGVLGIGALPIGTTVPISSPEFQTPDNTMGAFVDKAGSWVKENEGQLLNAGSYLANLASIRKLDTRVARKRAPMPHYNYTDRSGLAKTENQAMLNSTLGVLGSASGGANASNAGALYAETLNNNSKINNAENIRRDNYTEQYNQRSDRMTAYNNESENRAVNQERELNNYKNVEGPMGARNAFMQGYAGNKAVKQQMNLDNKKAMLTAAVGDDNGALTRFAKKMGFKDLNDFITNYVSK